MNRSNSIVWFKDIGLEDIGLVGGKAANLSVLANRAVNVPPGFCVTTTAFESFVQDNSVLRELRSEGGELQDISTLNLEIRCETEREIICAYKKLIVKAEGKNAVAVRSSANMEDSQKSSFAGQLRTYLNVKDEKSLIDAVKLCWLSPFQARVRSYAKKHKLSWQAISVGVIVQSMIDAEAAGIMFTMNPVTGDNTRAVVEAAWGLGEAIVSGAVTPDIYVVDKKSQKIIEKRVSEKRFMLAANVAGEGITRVELSEDKRWQEALTTEELRNLVGLGNAIEVLLSAPQDIEWAISKTNRVAYLLQTRPVTTA